MLLTNELYTEAVDSFGCWCCTQLCTLGFHQMCYHARKCARINSAAEEDADGNVRTQPIPNGFKQSVSHALDHICFQSRINLALFDVRLRYVLWIDTSYLVFEAKIPIFVLCGCSER
jgi:hypothetical protein